MYLYERKDLGQFSTTSQPHNPTQGRGYPIEPVPSAVEGLGQSPDDVRRFIRTGAEIKRQLERNFRADDVAGFLDRRRKLRQAFESVPRSFAQHLLAQLMDKNDSLAKLFKYKLATPTRDEMISILLGKSGEPI